MRSNANSMPSPRPSAARRASSWRLRSIEPNFALRYSAPAIPHRGLVKVGLEQVLVAELHQAGHAVLFRVLVGLLDALRVDVDADRAHSELLRRRDRDAPVARAEVVEHVALPDVG